MKRAIAAIFAAMVLASMAGAQIIRPGSQLSICVAADTNNGFVNPDLEDSAKDLRKALPRKGFAMRDCADADIRVAVTGRFTGSQIVGSETSINRGIFGGLFASNTPIVATWKYVFVRMEARDFSQVYYGYGKLWTADAEALANLIAKWAKANGDLLRSKK